MRWSTQTIYIDIETGELLRPDHIHKGIYIKVKCTITNKRKNEHYGTRSITWQCQRNNQLKLGIN